MRGRSVGIVCVVASCGAAYAGPEDSRQALEADPRMTAAPSAVLVRFQQGVPLADRQVVRDLVAGRLLRSYGLVPGLEHVEVGIDRDQALAVLRATPFVAYAEPDYVVHAVGTPNDTYFALQWGLHNTGQTIQDSPGVADADIDATEAWDTSTGDGSFAVAVIDSGTQWSHPDLDANIWSNPGEVAGNGVDDDANGFVDDVRGWDFYSDDNNPDDSDGHGTHTAGTVGAEGNNGVGVAGVNWQCDIMPLRFLGPQGGFTSDAIAAVDYAVANGALVSNNSWGGGGFSNALRDAIAQAGAQGHVFVAAAGNYGTNNDSSPFYPASYDVDTLISVAATTNTDALAGFSNYGLLSVDLGAPGVDIASTYTGSGYAWSSGTSMACPHVAGVAALVYAANPGFSAQDVVDRLLTTVRAVASLDGKTVTGGVVDAAAALSGATPPPPPPPVEPPAAPGTPSLSDVGSGVVRVSWSDNSADEDGFEVQREKQKKNGNWVGTAIVATVGADVTSVDDGAGGGTFRYRVRAFNAGGDSAWSAWSQITVAGGGGGGGGGGNGNGNGNGPPGGGG